MRTIEHLRAPNRDYEPSRHDRLLEALKTNGFSVAVQLIDNGCTSDIDPKEKARILFDELSETHGSDRVVMVPGAPVEYVGDQRGIRRPTAPSITSILLAPGVEVSDPKFAKNLSL